MYQEQEELPILTPVLSTSDEEEDDPVTANLDRLLNECSLLLDSVSSIYVLPRIDKTSLVMEP